MALAAEPLAISLVDLPWEAAVDNVLKLALRPLRDVTLNYSRAKLGHRNVALNYKNAVHYKRLLHQSPLSTELFNQKIMNAIIKLGLKMLKRKDFSSGGQGEHKRSR